MIEVEHCRGDEPERIAQWLAERDAPLVIDAGAAAWPAVGRWSPAYLEQLLGPIEIAYKTSTSNAHPDFRVHGSSRMFARERGRLADFFGKIGNGPARERCRYLFTGDEQFLLRRRAGETSVDPALAPLLSDIETPALFPEDRLHTVWAWFSGPGVRTWLHYDNNACHNLNAQVAGHKRCILYAPDDLFLLHPYPLGGDNPAYNCSRIDVEQPEPELASDLAAARGWHAELGPGDVLFIPAWWFHTFEHLGEFNANVNFWWKPEQLSWNVVAARQALVDAAARAELDLRDPAVASTLRALDAAARNRTEP
jgi:lysine-specific demethylase 8